MTEDEVIFQSEPRGYFYRSKWYRSVTEKIADVNYGPDFSHANPVQLEYARQRGNAVDMALMFHYDNDLDPRTVDPAIRGYIDAALRFDRECPGKIVAIHPRLCDPALGVAGTPDLIRFISGRRVVVDWKTGADNPLQTWMYLTLWNRKYPNTPCYERYGLRLRANGTYRLAEHNDIDDGAAAMAILRGDEKEIERWRPKYGSLPRAA